MTANPSAFVDRFALDRLPSRAAWPELIADRPELTYPARLNAAKESRPGESGRCDRWIFCLIAARMPRNQERL
jgi:hypothetical protein